MLLCIQQLLPVTLGRITSLYSEKCYWDLLQYALHNPWDQRLNVPSEGRSSNLLVSCLMTQVSRLSSPHSADQKHQSLSPVILTSWTLHAKKVYQVESWFIITIVLNSYFFICRLKKVWKPFLQKKEFYSEILDKTFTITVSLRTLDLIDEAYGFDFYILKVSWIYL